MHVFNKRDYFKYNFIYYIYTSTTKIRHVILAWWLYQVDYY